MLRALNLTARETHDLVTFLGTLSAAGATYRRRPFAADCR
jgi:hypothetical protein